MFKGKKVYVFFILLFQNPALLRAQEGRRRRLAALHGRGGLGGHRARRAGSRGGDQLGVVRCGLVGKGGVLRRVQHFQQGGARITLEGDPQLVHLIQDEDRPLLVEYAC